MAIVINGSGTVTGLAVGGLPDGTVDAGTLATNSVDSAELVDGSIDSSHLASGVGGVAGITSSADATAMTITSDEKVGIGVADPDSTLEVSNNTSTYTAHIASTKNATGDNALAITTYDENASNTSYLIRCTTNTNVAGAGNDRFAVMSDGRGKSEFTHAFWATVNQTGTQAIIDSHNISSITDTAVGHTQFNFANNMPNANYAVTDANNYDSGGWWDSNGFATSSCKFAMYHNGAYRDVSRLMITGVRGD